MQLLEEEQEMSEDSFDDELNYDEEIGNKRKSFQMNASPLKKVKYEDITSEKLSKKSKNELYKPPTVEELNELKETQNLYNNNLFRLQIEELIKEVKIKNKHQKTFTKWYEKFQSFLDELPEHSIPASDIKLKNKKKLKDSELIDAIANDAFNIDQDFVLKLIKPEHTEIFGLDNVKALPGPNLITNVNLKMPRACFNVKDYLNNRYFVKKHYYLAYIYFYLKKKDLGGDITWSCYNSNNFLEILEVKLNGKITVRICVTPTENYFKLSRFAAEVNNIKVNVFNNGVITEAPTLFYNACLAHDVSLSINNSFINQTLLELPNAQEAIKLLYVWVSQRELNIGVGSFAEELILYFIVYLFTKKRINKHMSSYQIIRSFWNFINEMDLTKNPITLADDLKNEVMEQFQTNYDVVFLDKTGYYNITAFLNVNMYKKLKYECKTAFKLLDDDGINSFHSLFITNLPTELQYDLILNLKSGSNFENILAKQTDEYRMKFLGHESLFLVKYIQDLLERAFNKRALLIVPLKVERKISDTISFGICLDPSNAFNILELGPALNDPKEKEFKEFWGELSTDRRFKDGSVCVAVYFKTKTVKAKREIIQKIVNWVVTRHLNLDYKLHYNDFEDLLLNKKVTASYPMGTNEECSLRAIAASDDLGKKLRGLEMPLAITGVQGISDTFSLTDVFPPISTNYRCVVKVTTILENNIIMNEKRIGIAPRYVKPIECVLQLEHSSKWPKDLNTLRHMKTAFYLQISKLLSKKHNLVSSVRPEFFDVLYDGYVFRYRVYISREVGLLKKETVNNGATIYKDTAESREMEMRLNVLPKLVGALKGLQFQYPSFGPTTALIKRWLRSQLIDGHHFPDDVINLLSASLFLNQSAFTIPNTPQIGFLRFLKFFSEFQWQIQAVVVNFNDEISKEVVAEIDSKLLQNREAYPNLVIATPYDNCESLFTKSAPSKEVLRRVKQLAAETLTHALKIIRGESLISIKSLFMPNWDGYDLVIHLRPLLNPVRHEQIIVDELEGQIVLKAFNASESTKIPVTGFNPVQCYLKELRNNYGDFANFFHDSYGGNLVGVLWIPKALESKDFKVSHVNGRKVSGDKLVLNVDAIIEDFFTLGQGLVKSIDKKK